MSDFNWDDHPIIEQPAAVPQGGAAFSWDDHPIVKPVEPKNSPLVSAVRKFTQGASAGFSDEAAGATEAAGRMVGVNGAGGPMKDISADPDGPTLDWDQIKSAYEKGRDKEREALSKDSKDNPKVSALSEFLGALASPVNKVAPGASIPVQAATVGAVTGLGNSDADSIGGMARDTATGAGLGLVGGAAAEKLAPYVGKAANSVGSYLNDVAETRSAKAMGATKALFKSEGAEGIRAIGRQGLDNGIVTPLASTDTMAARAADLKSRGGAKMGQVYKTIDDAGASAFNPLDVAANVDSKIGNIWRSPINRGETTQLENTLDSILLRGDKNIPLSEAQALKQEIGKTANWNKPAHLDITPKEQMARDAYGVVNSAIDDAAKNGAKSVGVDDLTDMLSQGKSQYQAGKGAEKLLANQQAKEGNNTISLTDAALGGEALMALGPKGGLLLVAKKIADKYGNQLAATGANGISKFLMKDPEMAQLATKAPAAFQDAVRQLESKYSGAAALPAAADKNQPTTGPDKWANDGLQNLIKHDSDFSDPKMIELLKNSQRGKDLLIKASDLSPGTKAMDNLVEKIRSSSKMGDQ